MAKPMQKKKVKVDSAGLVNPQIRPRKFPRYVIAELRHDSQVAYEPARFAGPTAVEKTCESLNRILGQFKVKRIESHFAMPPSQIRRRSTAAPPSLANPSPPSLHIQVSSTLRLVPTKTLIHW